MAHNCHGKTKNLTTKPKTSRQNQILHSKNKIMKILHGKTKYFTAKANTQGRSKYLTAKANTSRQKQKLTANVNTSRQKQQLTARAKTHGKSKYMHLTLEEESLEPKVLAKDVGPGGKSSMAAFDERTCFAQPAVQKLCRRRTFVSLPIVLRALSIFRLLLFLMGYPAGSL